MTHFLIVHFPRFIPRKASSRCSWNNLAMLIIPVIQGYSHLAQSCTFSRQFTSMHRLLELTIISLVVSGITTNLVKGSPIKLWSLGFGFFVFFKNSEPMIHHLCMLLKCHAALPISQKKFGLKSFVDSSNCFMSLGDSIQWIIKNNNQSNFSQVFVTQ